MSRVREVGVSRGPPGPHPLRVLVHLWIGATAIGLLAVIATALLSMYGGETHPWRVFKTAVAWLYPWALLSLVVRWLVARFPFFEPPRVGVLVHAVAMLVIGFIGQTAASMLIWVFGISDSPWPEGPGLYLWSLAIYVALAGGLQLRAEQDRRRRQQLALESLHGKLAGARLEALSQQLQPHFLFNTLNAISSFVSLDPERAEDMLEELASLLRSSLIREAGSTVPFEYELGLARSYLKIQEARLGDRLNVSISVTPEAGRGLVPHLLLQPLIENAIEHGVARCEAGGVVSVFAHREEDSLVIGLTNPIPESRRGTVAGHGMGLDNVRLRLEAQYGEAASLELSKNRAEGSVHCVVRLPWEEAAIS